MEPQTDSKPGTQLTRWSRLGCPSSFAWPIRRQQFARALARSCQYIDQLTSGYIGGSNAPDLVFGRLGSMGKGPEVPGRRVSAAQPSCLRSPKFQRRAERTESYRGHTQIALLIECIPLSLVDYHAQTRCLWSGTSASRSRDRFRR